MPLDIQLFCLTYFANYLCSLVYFLTFYIANTKTCSRVENFKISIKTKGKGDIPHNHKPPPRNIKVPCKKESIPRFALCCFPPVCLGVA